MGVNLGGGSSWGILEAACVDVAFLGRRVFGPRVLAVTASVLLFSPGGQGVFYEGCFAFLVMRAAFVALSREELALVVTFLEAIGVLVLGARMVAAKCWTY